jgi:hypothetical protein
VRQPEDDAEDAGPVTKVTVPKQLFPGLKGADHSCQETGVRRRLPLQALAEFNEVLLGFLRARA